MKKELFDELIESVKEAGRIHRGEVAPSRQFAFAPVDIKAIRARLDKSQEEFALMIGVSVATLRNWEQGRNAVDPAARSLLILIARDPEATLAALARKAA